VSVTGGAGVVAIHFLLTVILAAILYSQGEVAANGVIAFARRIGGDRAEQTVRLAAQAARGVALGIVVTALVQSLITGLALWISGVPRSGVLLAISGWMFDKGHLDATTQTFCWIVIFFFASAGASAAYLTVSETWPIEIRAEAIAVFFAIAQVFGAFGPVFYGWLIGDGSDTTGLFIGYVIGGAIMVLGGIVELAIGIKAEGKSLEEITKPITSTAASPAAVEPAAAT